MGIFTRVRDIISSNINAMLDKAEDPEKLVKMMIREMEDTLVEVKASCAGAMATKKKLTREIDDMRQRADAWQNKAKLALEKNREDLAREALVEKKRYVERTGTLETEAAQCDALVDQYHNDIRQLEDKLTTARERQRILVHRHVQAANRKRAEARIRRIDTSDAFVRFEGFEHRIDQMEAEANLVNFGRKPSLEDELSKLDADDEIDRELNAMKEQQSKRES